MQRYIRKVCDSIVDTTLKGQKGGLLADSKANQPRDPYAVSMDRATNVAENEANTILNGDEYNAAIKMVVPRNDGRHTRTKELGQIMRM